MQNTSFFLNDDFYESLSTHLQLELQLTFVCIIKFYSIDSLFNNQQLTLGQKYFLAYQRKFLFNLSLFC